MRARQQNPHQHLAGHHRSSLVKDAMLDNGDDLSMDMDLDADLSA
jgi:hypothetical protein